MKMRKTVPAGLSIALVLLTFVCMVLMIIMCINAGEAVVVCQGITFLLAAVMAYVYCIMGYRKNSAKYFKLFCGTASLYALAMFVGTEGMSKIIPLLNLVITVFYAVLALAKDLGMKKSFGMAGIVWISSLVVLIAELSAGIYVTGLGLLLLATILGIIVYAKYADKLSRGRAV